MTTTVQQVQDLAAELQTLRPDWPDPIPVANFLLPWRHIPIDQLRSMTTAWVKDPGNRTPASLKWMPGVPPQTAGISSTRRKSKQDQCYICGRSRSDCAELRQWEIDHGIPDRHDFETKDEADANTGKVQFNPRQLALAAMPRVNEYEESDERKAAKSRARAAIRPMLTTAPGQPT